MALNFLTPVGLSYILHAIGKLKKKPLKKNLPYFKPSITALIPAKNEASNIPYSLLSLNKQTIKPDKVYIIDDGSTDGTYDIAEKFKNFTDLNLKIKRRTISQGKTASLKEVTRNSGSDLIFVLDADTIIEENYLEELVNAHCDEKVVSACGIVKPMTKKFKQNFYEKEIEGTLDTIMQEIENPNSSDKDTVSAIKKINPRKGSKIDHILRLPVLSYRAGVYNYVQHFLNDAEQRLFKTTFVPVGCGVVYKRKELQELFDKYEKDLGNNLTNSEDIFIGFGICDKGYRNIQLKNVSMATTEPKVNKLMKQLYLWSSSYLQSSYYFSDFMKTPFKYFGKDKENIKPIGWVNSLTVAEKLFYPALLTGLGFIDPLLVPLTMALEHGVYTTTNLATAPKGSKIRITLNSLLSFPLRAAAQINELYTMGKVGYDIIKGNRNWRK